MKRLLIAIGVCGAAAAAHADWTGTGEAGLIFSDGNTETETANARLEVGTETGRWEHHAGLAGLYASTGGDKTAQRWELFGESDYSITEKTFGFGAGRYEKDEFSGFEYQATVSAGLGRRFIDNDRTRLTATGGIGYKFFETRDSFDALGALIEAGDDDSEIVFRGTADFEHAFTGTTSVVNGFVLESGATNTYLENALALQVKMNAKLALALGYTIRHNTDPPGGFEKTDKLTTINLVYEFK